VRHGAADTNMPVHVACVWSCCRHCLEGDDITKLHGTIIFGLGTLLALLTAGFAADGLFGAGVMMRDAGGRTPPGGGRMSALPFLIPIALFLGGLGLVAFLWSLKSGQYEDLEGAARRS